MPMAGKIKRSGFTAIEIMIVVTILAILAVIAIPNLLRARLQSNEASTIQNLRAITGAEGAYFAANGEYATAMTDLTSSTPAFLDHDFLLEPLSGYLFVFGGDPLNYTLTADPISWGLTGNRGFYTDASGIIRYNVGATATAANDPLK